MDTCEQDSPFAVQVELVEGCNRRCSFCGINGIRGAVNDLRFMTTETADAIIARLKEARWYPRLEFAMHGEPSLLPDMLGMLKRFRSKLPSRIPMMMTSNGAGFLRQPTNTIDGALEHLNVLAIEDYEGSGACESILRRYAGHHKPIYYPKQPEGNPHRRRNPDEHDLVIVASIDIATAGTHATLNNHCGCGAPLNDSAAGKRCAKPFRELSVRYDGMVALCCNDWRGYYRCGNVLKASLDEIWNGPAMQAARRKLYWGERDFTPCKGCDATSYRPGLLPDKKGVGSLPRATAADAHAIRKALAEDPLAMPVLRPWERKEKAPSRGRGFSEDRT